MNTKKDKEIAEEMKSYLEAILTYKKNSINNDNKRFITNPNLKDKVTNKGKFHSFYGDTI